MVSVLPLDIDIGRRVAKGEVLVRLAVPELDAQFKHKQAPGASQAAEAASRGTCPNVAAKELLEAEKQEKKYQADYTQRKDKHDRTDPARRRAALQPEVAVETRSALESAQAAWQAARAQIETRQAKLKAVEADQAVAVSKIVVAEAEVANLVALVDYATLRVLSTASSLAVGSIRRDHQGCRAPLLTVMHTDTVRVFLDIPERHVALVNARDKKPNADGQGDHVILNIPALAAVSGGGEFTGTVTRTAQALDPATRTIAPRSICPTPRVI